MITVRKSADRGRTEIGWLDSRHTFSFGDYHDPRQMGFHGLRVINDDRVAPDGGFPPHAHRDMEIVTYVLDGALSHEDSLGNGSTIRPGDVQRMSAGTGVVHGEMNASAKEPVHFLQIWIVPAKRGIAPGYEQRTFAPDVRRGRLVRVAAAAKPGERPDDGAIAIHADAAIHAALLAPGQKVAHEFAKGRGGWVQVARGELLLNGTKLAAGDGAAITDEQSVELVGVQDAELLLFDLA